MHHGYDIPSSGRLQDPTSTSKKRMPDPKIRSRHPAPVLRDTYIYVFYARASLLIRLLTNPKIKAPPMADIKPDTVKPGTKTAAKISIRPFRTKVNSPKVRKLSGSVRIRNMGRTKALTIPMTAAAKRAVNTPLT